MPPSTRHLSKQRQVRAASLLALGLMLALSSCKREVPEEPTSGAVPPQIALVPASASAATDSAAPDAGAPRLSPQARIEDERNSIQIFREVAPSVAYVTQKRQVMDRFAMRALEVPSGSGSAFIWDDAGHVVTNFHVISGAASLSVTLYDQKSYEAKVVGTEPRKDIAVLALIGAPKASLVPIPRNPQGTNADLEVGQKAIAIGNPFGLDHTLTTGIVSALGREVQGVGGVTIRDMIQTDAAINPGNSGGPLLDSSGRLIGMNTMIFSKSGASAGIGFAVPLSIINRIVPQLIEKGVAAQVGIGVQIDPQGRLERRAGIRGVVVLSATPGSPAERAGLSGITESARGIQIGDVIVRINDKPVANYDDLYNLLDQYQVGQQVTLGVSRGGKERPVELTLVQVN